MKRRKLQQLTDRQLQVMDILWDRGSATVAQVHDAMRRTRLARKTVATLLSRMEEQRLVTHIVDGRVFVYSARVTREDVARAKIRSILDFVLPGSAPLIRYALEADDIEAGDIARVEALLREHRSGDDRA